MDRGPKPLSTDRDERHLIWMSLNHRKKSLSDMQKAWQAVAGVKCTVSMVKKQASGGVISDFLNKQI